MKLQYLEREKEVVFELSRLRYEQRAEEAKALCKTQIKTYGISNPVDLPVVSCENSTSYPKVISAAFLVVQVVNFVSKLFRICSLFDRITLAYLCYIIRKH